jgi:hypothetical protein
MTLRGSRHHHAALDPSGKRQRSGTVSSKKSPMLLMFITFCVNKTGWKSWVSAGRSPPGDVAL